MSKKDRHRREAAATQAARGEALLAEGKAREAIAAFDAALRKVPDDVSSIMGRAAAYAAVADLASAESGYRKAVAIEPANGAAWVGLARTLFDRIEWKGFSDDWPERTPDVQDAFDAIDKALTLQPGSADAHILHAEISECDERWKKAIESWSAAIDIRPEEARLSPLKPKVA